ncbi:MAG: exopolysaccharide biosynthesis protein [Betaproteobacteria bacterium]
MASLADVLARSLDPNHSGAEVAENVKMLPPAPGAQHSVDEIAYTRTRVVNVPKALLRENRVISGFAPGPIVDAYKIMCIQTLQRLRALNGNALAVVSPGRHEGKTLTAINLALSFAQEVDQTVLLVDANLREPSVHRYFGFTPEAGLSDYLLSGTPLDRILVNPGVERFVILPGGRPLLNSAEMLGSAKMEKLVQELKMRYPSRLVIFDLSPVLSVADALAFAPYVDAALMVAQEHKTRRQDIVRAAEMLRAVELIGTVLNMAGEASQGAHVARKPGHGWFRRLARRRE